MIIVIWTYKYLQMALVYDNALSHEKMDNRKERKNLW